MTPSTHLTCQTLEIRKGRSDDKMIFPQEPWFPVCNITKPSVIGKVFYFHEDVLDFQNIKFKIF